MKMYVGLGNPGKEYEGTRHNMGFRALDRFADLAGAVFDRQGFKGVYGVVRNPAFAEPIILLKPQTFMNLSGASVRPLADYYRIGPADIVVVYDEMALPCGEIRLRENGSAGGHHGMESVIEAFGTESIPRIRIGIGEPPKEEAIDYVLGKPKPDEAEALAQAVDNAAKALRDIELRGLPYAMSVYNGLRQKE